MVHTISRYQLQYLLKELSSRSELHWLNYALKIPLSVKTVHNLPIYRQLSWLIYKIKPHFSEWLQKWLALYFTVIFSDGFESGDLTAWDSSTTTAGETIAASTTVTKTGSWSMKATADGSAETQRAYVQKAINAVTEIYIRLYIYFDDLPNLNTDGEACTFIRVLSGATILVDVKAVSHLGTHIDWTIVFSPTSGYARGTTALTADTWYVAELHYKEAAPEQETVQLYIDGIETLHLHDDTSLQPDLDTVRVGFAYMNGGHTVTEYIDNVIIADAYVGPEVYSFDGGTSRHAKLNKII